MTQKQLEVASGVKQATISEMETGGIASSGHTATFASVLKVNALWLQTGKGIPKANVPMNEPEGTAALGSLDQLIADWKSLPEGWQFYLCNKANKLRAWSDGMPGFIRDALKPIPNDSGYHAWERRLEESLAAKEEQDKEPERGHKRTTGRASK